MFFVERATVIAVFALLAALPARRFTLAPVIRANKGVSDTAVLTDGNHLIKRAALGWQTSDTPTFSTVLPWLRRAYAQATVELFRDGQSAIATALPAARSAAAPKRFIRIR